MEQFSLDFGDPEQEKPLSIDELVAAYKASVGVIPRTDDREALMAAIADPEAEVARLREEDTASDHEEIERTYRRS